MRRFLSIALLCATLLVASQTSPAVAQSPAAPAQSTNIYKAPGYYGTSWGSASYKVPRTYTSFSSPYGGGYGYGYAPYSVLPGQYGAGLWRNATVAPGYVYGSPSGYSTYAKPFRQYSPVYGPGIGAYAPAFGPFVPPIMMAH